MSRRIARFVRVALISLLVMAMLSSSALATSVPVRINTKTKVYQYPTTAARWLPAPKALSVSMTGYSKGWARVSYKGRTGYIPVKYLTLKNPIKAYAATNATVYRSAGSDSMGTVPKGTAVYVIGADGSYARVQNKSGSVKGYIKGSQLTRTQPSAPAASSGIVGAAGLSASLRSTTSSSGGSRIEYTIYVAQNLIGAPYAESADPPKTFDCAKFAYYCYGKAKSGVLKGSSKAQGYDDRFERIDAISELRRGDLVCFDTVEDDDQCDHVGIYVGDGYFIHASSAAKKVIVSTLSSGYYNRTFSWARRIFNS